MVSAPVDDPVGDPRAQSAGSARDENRPRRRPDASLAAAPRPPDEAPGEHPGLADRDLVLSVRGGYDGPDPLDHPVRHLSGGPRGDVDEPTPALRALERGHAAKAPPERRRRINRRIGRAGRNRLAGQAPQRRVDPGVAQGLHQRQRVRKPGRNRCRRFAVRQREQRDQSGGGLGCRRRAQQFRHGAAVAIGGSDGDVTDGNASGCEQAADHVRPLPLPRRVRRPDDEPVAGEGAQRRVVDATPCHLVTPAVQRCRITAALAPRGQGRQQVGQPVPLDDRVGARSGQDACEGFGVAVGDRPPELRFGRVVAVGGRVLLARIGPVALPVKGVGGQVDEPAAGPGMDRRPVHWHTLGEHLGQAGEEPIHSPVVPAKGPDGDHFHTGCLRGLPDRGCQHRMRAGFHEHPKPVRYQPTNSLFQTDGFTQIAIPIAGVHQPTVQPLPRHRGVHR